MFDTVDPAHPVQDCTLDPADGGRFLSGTRIAFWTGNSLRVADIASGSVEVTAMLPAVPSIGVFSSDGSSFAYSVGDDTAGLSTHLFRAGNDRTLITRPAIGGHGVSPIGPFYQLEFSSDGKYLLSVDSLDANFPSSEPPNFLVYDQNGNTVFQSASAEFGTWAAHGDQLYFLDSPGGHGGIMGDLQSWDPSAGVTTVTRSLNGYFWPAVSPDGHRLVFNSFDSAFVPHLWGVDVTTGAIGQLSTSTGEHPVFVGRSVVWSNETCKCGMGEGSVPDGKVSVTDLQTGRDLTLALPGYEVDVTSEILDVWL